MTNDVYCDCIRGDSVLSLRWEKNICVKSDIRENHFYMSFLNDELRIIMSEWI